MGFFQWQLYSPLQQIMQKLMSSEIPSPNLTLVQLIQILDTLSLKKVGVRGG